MVKEEYSQLIRFVILISIYDVIQFPQPYFVPHFSRVNVTNKDQVRVFTNLFCVK